MAESHDVFHTPAPHGNGTGDVNASGAPVASGAASSAAQAIGNTAPNEYIVMIGTADFHVRFGLAAVGAATANDLFIPAKTFVRFDLRLAQETAFRVIQDTAAGLVYWYRASGG